MVNTIMTIREALQPFIVYIAIAAIVTLISRVKQLRHVLWIPVGITALYLICWFSLKVAGL